mmetsp:Transcript_22462/g.27685  ORF Transcript_22462/g.27685 Transcript_22462/m.27685 type:complete len:115 (+) Transcript_22462:37-381(+)
MGNKSSSKKGGSAATPGSTRGAAARRGPVKSGEPGGPDRLTLLLSNRTQMSISELLPYLDLQDLIELYKVNRYCKSLMTPSDPRCLRFEVLFQRQVSQFESAPYGWQESIIEMS